MELTPLSCGGLLLKHSCFRFVTSMMFLSPSPIQECLAESSLVQSQIVSISMRNGLLHDKNLALPLRL